MSFQSARPKRAAEDYARTTHGSEFDGQPSKKPRFDVRNPSALAPDALEDDATLEADVIGSRGQQVRRGAVNIDGYDSDSENENFDARANAKSQAKEAKTQEEDENDMFADLNEDFKDGDDSEGDNVKRGGKKKAVRFLDENEIEGQVKSSKSGGHVSADFSLNGHANDKPKAVAKEDIEVESSSESEVGDDIRASTGEVDAELGAGSKKTHAPKLDAFNMRDEQEEGRFDDQGNFVRKAVDPDAIHDLWMEGVSKKEMRKAKEAAEKRDHERRQKDLQDDAKSTGEILQTLIPYLERGETVLEALARFGRGLEKKPKWQLKNKNKKKSQEDMDTSFTEKTSGESRRRKTIEAITEAADLLMSRGQIEIYEAERESLVRQYRKETGDDWIDQSAQASSNSISENDAKLWEYRWTDARDSGMVNGPYDSATMKQWSEAGYFGDEVEFRLSGDDGLGEWSRVLEFG